MNAPLTTWPERHYRPALATNRTAQPITPKLPPRPDLVCATHRVGLSKGR
jgi:hypothetical protein